MRAEEYVPCKFPVYHFYRDNDGEIIQNQHFNL